MRTRSLMLVLLFFGTTISLAAQQQARPKPPSPPTPRRADGTVNLGSTEPNKGFFQGRQHWGYEEGTWIDCYGDPHTDQLHVIERYSRPDLMTLHYQATIEDPGAYTRPWTIAFDLAWNPNGEIMEYICQENNLWLKRLTKQQP